MAVIFARARDFELMFSFFFFRLSESWGTFTALCFTQFRKCLQVFTFATLQKVRTCINCLHCVRNLQVIELARNPIDSDINRNLQVIVSGTWKNSFRASRGILLMPFFSAILLLQQQQISHLALNCLPQHQI